MKNKLLVIVLMFVTVAIYGQKHHLKGTVGATDGTPLVGASVAISESYGAVTDLIGEYDLILDATADSVQVQYRMLGYALLDTVLVYSDKDINLDVVLTPISYEQPTIEITADGFNAFQNEQWRILDIDVHEGRLLILYLKGMSRYIELFSENGLSIQKSELKTPYREIFNSCMGGLHLVGEDRCVEVSMEADGLRPVKEYGRLMFDKSLTPCMYKNDEYTILKYWFNHNKKARYFKYQNEELTVLKEIFDELSASTAQSYYRDIISSYYYYTNNPQEGAIDLGIPRENIIVDGSWSGDLLELAINNDLHNQIAYFLNVEARPLKLKELSIDDTLYIFDVVNESVLMYHDSLDSIKTYSAPDYIWSKSFELMIDAFDNTPYLLQDKQVLYELSFVNWDCRAVAVNSERQADEKMFGAQIYNNVLYYYTTDRVDAMKSSVYKVAIEIQDSDLDD